MLAEPEFSIITTCYYEEQSIDEFYIYQGGEGYDSQ
jgi:hypothetical protein